MVWLGVEEDDSNVAMDAIDDVADKLRDKSEN